MTINNVINKYKCEWINKDGLYRYKVNVKEVFFVSIIAGPGAYSEPQTMLNKFSDYDFYEIAFFDMDNNWLKVEPKLSNPAEVTYERYELTDTWAMVSPLQIKNAIDALLEAWQG